MTVWDNTDRMDRIRSRISHYIRISLAAIRKGVPIGEILRTQFPFVMKDASKPPSVHVEFTNACNLKCVYCNNSLFPSPREFMQNKTLESLISNIKGAGIGRVIVGGGEPTLHPQFEKFASSIGMCAKYASIVTNAQWEEKEIAHILLRASFGLIEMSVDAGGKENYERSRRGASYEKLLENISYIRRSQRFSASKTLIGIRLMVRPSKLVTEKEEIKFWKKYCDTIISQYIVKGNESQYSDDVFIPKQALEQSYPKCSIVFKNMQVRVNGDVPLCQVSGSSLRKERKIVLGNINAVSLTELWDNSAIRQYREAHRCRNTAKMPICKGCRGC